MKDSQCVEFLQWALPRLGMRWAGFRKVRRQVCKRLGRRLAELSLPDLDAYRALLERDPDEWPRLERLTHITISRFYRDRGVFGFLAAEVLPALAATGVVRAWSAGCASGEEAYTLALVWELGLAKRFPSATFEALASDVEESMLGRALRPGGALVLGRHETLPGEVAGFAPWSAAAGVYRRVPAVS